jgi:hypothetical protein
MKAFFLKVMAGGGRIGKREVSYEVRGILIMDMSKINQSDQQKVGSSPSKTRESGFKEVFDQKMNEINETVPQTLLEGKANVLKQGDKILNLLDDYGKVLTNPTMTLKEIEPLVERIEQEVSLFEVDAAQVSHEDEALDRLTQDLATTAQVALYKFRRGDLI